MARDRVHIDLWRSLALAQARTYRAEATQLRGQIAEFEQKLANRPVREVERYIGADEIQAHKDEADRAFRSRKNAWQALCEIHLLHREGGLSSESWAHRRTSSGPTY